MKETVDTFDKVAEARFESARLKVQDVVNVEFEVKNEQCPQCKKNYTDHKEKAIVQAHSAWTSAFSRHEQRCPWKHVSRFP